MTYHHKMVQNLLKIRKQEPRSGGVGGLLMHLVNVLAQVRRARARALGGIPLGPLSGHPVVLRSVGHVLRGDAAYQRVSRVAICKK